MSGSGTQMKYFLTSPDINEQKPPWLASPGPGEARIMTISRCGCSGSVTGTWDSGPGINQQRRQHGDRGRDVTTTCRCSVQCCGDLMLIRKLQSISGVFVMCVWCVYGVVCCVHGVCVMCVFYNIPCVRCVCGVCMVCVWCVYGVFVVCVW